MVYLKNNKNLGPGISRNIGIKKSKGKYLFFLDSDDFLKKSYFLDVNIYEVISMVKILLCPRGTKMFDFQR